MMQHTIRNVPETATNQHADMLPAEPRKCAEPENLDLRRSRLLAAWGDGPGSVMTVYACGVDFDAIEALDVHAHVSIDWTGRRWLDGESVRSVHSLASPSVRPIPTIDAMAQYYRDRRMAAVVFTIDATAATGRAPNSVEEIAERAALNRDVLIPFGSVDPWQGTAAVRRVHRLIGEYGVCGFKFHPSMQAFEPNDRRFYPIYEAIAEYRLPLLFHTGQTCIGAGRPGGRGIKLRYSDPMLLDDVAADFPELTIVMAHPAVPWVDAQIAVATHKANVYIDLSGTSPTQFPPQLVHAIKTSLSTKVLFGSGYPVHDADRWRDDFANLGIPAATLPRVLKDNALRVLGVGGT